MSVTEQTATSDLWKYFSLTEHAFTFAQSTLDIEAFLEMVNQSHYTKEELSYLVSFLLSNYAINDNLKRLERLVSIYNLNMRGALLGQLAPLSEDVSIHVLSFCPFSQDNDFGEWERNIRMIVKFDNHYLLERYIDACPPSKRQQKFLIYVCIEKSAIQCFQLCKKFVHRNPHLIKMAVLWQSKTLPLLLDGKLIPHHIGRDVFKMLHRWSLYKKKTFYTKAIIRTKSEQKFAYEFDIHQFMDQQQRFEEIDHNMWWEYLAPHLTPPVRNQMIKAKFFSQEVWERQQLLKSLLPTKTQNTSKKKRM